MLYEAKVYQMNVEDHLFWVAESNALKGCTGQGDSSEEAIRELEENEKVWLETAKEFNIPIPPHTAKREKVYSGKVSLRMSPFVHEEAAEQAESLGISLNQYINDAILSYKHDINQHTQIPYTDNITQIIDFKPREKEPITFKYTSDLEEM